MTRRSMAEPDQYRLPDGCVGTLLARHGHQLALRVSRPNWPFPRDVVVDRDQCVKVELDLSKLEEAPW